MEKRRVGPHLFQCWPNDKGELPPIQACTVVAVNDDDTAAIIVYEVDGSSSFIDKAVLMQKLDDCCPCCYTDRAPGEDEIHPCHKEEEQPVMEGSAGHINRMILTYNPNNSQDSNMTCWQGIEIYVPNGATYNDYVQGLCELTVVDGPHQTSPGGSRPNPPPPAPALQIPITGGNIPWWWLAPPPNPPGTTIYKPTPGTSLQYYY